MTVFLEPSKLAMAIQTNIANFDINAQFLNINDQDLCKPETQTL
jgi:hypothetical protein